MRRSFLYTCVGMLAIGLCSCATDLKLFPTGPDAYFHGRWWNYYDRGAARLDAEELEAAAADFEEALTGRARDAWQARTYGLHFVEYFPNRELGIVYYKQGRLDDAETYLSRSLNHVDTARAHHYLDLITKSRIESGELTDESAPVLETALGEQAVLPTRSIPLEIAASDDIGVTRVRLNGTELHQRGSQEQVSFSDELKLDEGRHDIQLEAIDLAGKQTDKTVQVTVDLTGPTVGVYYPTPELVTQEATIELRGAAADTNGVASVRLGDDPIATAQGDSRVDFSRNVALVEGENTFVVTATDTAGNETYSVVTVYRGAAASPAARLWQIEQRQGGVALAGSSLEGAITTLFTGATEGEALEIRLKYPKAEASEQPYRKDELRVTGTVLARTGGVQSLTIGDDTYEIIDAPTVEFSKRIPMIVGKNTVPIEAQDTTGHVAREQIDVTAMPVLIDEDEWKMSVSLQHIEATAQDMQDLLRFHMESKLVSRNRFRVVERAEIEQLLQELEIATSDLADPNFALRVGKIRPADIFLYSQVVPRENNALEILTKVISVESGSILTTHDTYVENMNDTQELEFKADGIARWLERTFPRRPGAVSALVGNSTLVNLGEDDGVQKGMYVVLTYEALPAEIDPDSGEIYREAYYEALGRAPVVRVMPSESKLDNVEVKEDNAEADLVQVGTPVFTM